MSRIQNAFECDKPFIPFITCGDPDLETTGQLIRAAAENGAGIIELGIPFSDPVAEGPVIMEANSRALANGVTTDKVFELVKDVRKDVRIPLVFMTYANVVFSYGVERFVKRCVEVGIDGIILPDVPYEEKEEFAPICEAYGVDFISLIAPSSENRIAMIAKAAKGFIYVVSSLGVTGVRQEIKTDLASVIAAVRNVSSIPCAIGFGISTQEQAKSMAQLADGVIVGSAIMNIVSQYGKESVQHVAEYVRSMKDSMSKV